MPDVRTERIFSSLSSRMPVRRTCSSRNGTFIKTIASAATFTAASQPSKSALGSLSATPIACARRTPSSKERPFSISVSTTFVVGSARRKSRAAP